MYHFFLFSHEEDTEYESDEAECCEYHIGESHTAVSCEDATTAEKCSTGEHECGYNGWFPCLNIKCDAYEGEWYQIKTTA